MTRGIRMLLQLTTTALMALGVAALSAVPWAAEPSETAVVRLAWRFRSTLVEQCRRLTAEELARRPAHMRRAVECARELRPYRLEVEMDGEDVLRETVAARGARSDRPLSVFHQLPRPAGQVRLKIAFEPLGEHDDDDDDRRLRSFVLDTTVVLEPRVVLLVTMDENETGFRVSASPARSTR